MNGRRTSQESGRICISNAPKRESRRSLLSSSSVGRSSGRGPANQCWIFRIHRELIIGTPSGATRPICRLAAPSEKLPGAGRRIRVMIDRLMGYPDERRRPGLIRLVGRIRRVKREEIRSNRCEAATAPPRMRDRPLQGRSFVEGGLQVASMAPRRGAIRMRKPVIPIALQQPQASFCLQRLDAQNGSRSILSFDRQERQQPERTEASAAGRTGCEQRRMVASDSWIPNAARGPSVPAQ